MRRVLNQRQAVIRPVNSRLDSSVFKLWTLPEHLHGGMPLEPVFDAVAQRPLVGFQFYDKVAIFLTNLVNYVLLHAHRVGRDDAAENIYLVKQNGDGCNLVAFLSARLGGQCDARIG